MNKKTNDVACVKFEELKAAISVSGVIDFSEILLGCIEHNPLSWVKLMSILKDDTVSVTQKIPIYKMARYLSGVLKVEDDLGKACELSDRLFGDEKTRKNNGLRLYKYITEAETDEKIDNLVDISRAFLIGLIDLPNFFRAYKAILETLPEDLKFLSVLIYDRLTKDTEVYQGNTSILALSRSGLMIIAGDDGNKGVEEQDYAITELGYMVDRYGLSINDNERQVLYRKTNLGKVKYNPNVSAIPVDIVNDCFNNSSMKDVSGRPCD